MSPTLLIGELERFDIPNRRRTVMRSLILWQAELGVDVLRLDARCGALSRLCGAERCMLSRNHARSELEALTRDGMIILNSEAGALLVRVVKDPLFWRCSQVMDRSAWLSSVNSLRLENGLQQLSFCPNQFEANEHTVAEIVAGSSPFVSFDSRGALPVSTPEAPSGSPIPTYSHDSHIGKNSHNGNDKPLAISAQSVSPSNSNSNKIESPIRISNSKCAIPIMGNGWRSDGYIVEKLLQLRPLAYELQEGITKSSTEFEELYALSPERARQLIGNAAALPDRQANGRPTNVCRWFNRSVCDQLQKAQA